MYFVPDDTDRAGFYECEECGQRFLDVKILPRMVCPYCGDVPDMEVAPGEEMPEVKEAARLLETVEGHDQVEKYDTLISLALTGGNYDWI